MRIKNIELHNFGSYADHNSFSFESSTPEERVVVIGGKNGAGKTTLFTAVQVCLYGHYAFGYKSASKKYFSDSEYGEWYGYLRRDGNPTLPACIGSTFKGPFHVPRCLIMLDKMLEEIEERG